MLRLREVHQMKMATIGGVLVAALVGASLAAAQTPYNFVLDGSGSLLLDDPTYSGDIVGQLLGTFTITIDDTGWPGENDVNPTRFEYIWDTFFAANYDTTPGAAAWFGDFDAQTLPGAPQFVFDTSIPGGILAGDISIRILVRDWDGDQVLDPVEKYDDHQLNASLNVNPFLGTGAFVEICGYGSLGSGEFNFVDPPGVDEAQFPGLVFLDECPPQPVEPSTWTAVKALFR
jgi:hypothetical protein